jgi:hypothetical protein
MLRLTRSMTNCAPGACAGGFGRGDGKREELARSEHISTHKTRRDTPAVHRPRPQARRPATAECCSPCSPCHNGTRPKVWRMQQENAGTDEAPDWTGSRARSSEKPPSPPPQTPPHSPSFASDFSTVRQPGASHSSTRVATVAKDPCCAARFTRRGLKDLQRLRERARDALDRRR